MTSIVEMVRHYQRSIEKSLENPARLLHCVEKLNKLPITVEHLQETGVGKTVNNLRKYDGEVGYASKALVSKWKTMVAKEEAENDSPDEEEASQEQDESHADDDDDHEDEPDDDEEENQLQIDETENIEPPAESSSEEIAEKSNHESHHKKSSKHSSDRKHKHHTSSSSSHSKTDKKHKESSKSRHKDKESSRHESRKSEKSSKSSSSSDTKSHKHHKDSEKHEKSSHHHQSSSKSDKKSSSDPNSSKEKKQESSRDTKKDPKTHENHESERKKSSKKDKDRDRDRDDKDAKKRKRENNEFQIDSTMGASFADALGMLDMPSSSKTAKKLEKASTSAPQPTSSSKKSSSHSSSSSASVPAPVSTKKLMAEPEALSKRPRLEPLLDIVADIPAPTFTISNNYKPMPLNQTVMDCVFSQQSAKPTKQMTDEEALTYSIMSNKSRTKVFSGNKANARGKVDTLFDLCIRVLQDHIDYLEYTGGVPFDILRPVLERCSYEQLMTLEDYNPYLIEDSDVLWEQHCKRRFRGKCPEEMESWREMFLRCLDEEQAKFKNLTANIKLARDKKLPVRKTKLAYVDTTVKAPRGIKSRQMKYGTDTLPNVTPAARVESLRNIGGNAASIGDRRLKIAAELRNSIPTHGPRINPNKKAPLMAKTLISMKKVFKR
ncbi:transcription elongation factor B polypeptide 3 isoform X2 [Culicoides brevitarsis]|uniref:transcription elongation factor B polypeptide 3 isoform X2 n=1 Tax=Culicoides brevitarsis TaxID=469753 RepID=UPI00307C5099